MSADVQVFSSGLILRLDSRLAEEKRQQKGQKRPLFQRGGFHFICQCFNFDHFPRPAKAIRPIIDYFIR